MKAASRTAFQLPGRLTTATHATLLAARGNQTVCEGPAHPSALVPNKTARLWWFLDYAHTWTILHLERKKQGHHLFLSSSSDLKASCTEVISQMYPIIYIFCKPLAFFWLMLWNLFCRLHHLKPIWNQKPCLIVWLIAGAQGIGAGQHLPFSYLPAGPVLMGHSEMDPFCHASSRSPQYRCLARNASSCQSRLFE